MFKRIKNLIAWSKLEPQLWKDAWGETNLNITARNIAIPNKTQAKRMATIVDLDKAVEKDFPDGPENV